MVASYLELYEEGEVEHINGPTHPSCLYHDQATQRPIWGLIVGSYFALEVRKAVNIADENENWPYTIDMLDLTLLKIQFQIARNYFVV